MLGGNEALWRGRVRKERVVQRKLESRAKGCQVWADLGDAESAGDGRDGATGKKQMIYLVNTSRDNYNSRKKGGS